MIKKILQKIIDQELTRCCTGLEKTATKIAFKDTDVYANIAGTYLYQHHLSSKSIIFNIDDT